MPGRVTPPPPPARAQPRTPERVRGGGAASENARQPHTKEGRGEGCDLPSFNLVRQLLHLPHPLDHLATVLDGLLGEEPVTVVAVRLTFRSSRRGAAVHAAPAVRHRWRAARTAPSRLRPTAGRQVHG